MPTKSSIFAYFVLFLNLFFAACEDDKAKAEQEHLHQEIMAVHDDVMPKMGELNRLRKVALLYNKTISLEQVELKDSLLNTIIILGKADDFMKDWMHNYHYPDAKKDHAATMKYLQEQKMAADSMSNQIYMSIAIANSVLKNAPDSVKGKKF